MALVVTGVSFFIHIYSVGYMHDDPGYTRYFTYLNLFVFMMLNLNSGQQLPVDVCGWEGVGLCSYLLIGFWYEKDSAANAGKKAFVVNRVGTSVYSWYILAFHQFWDIGFYRSLCQCEQA